MDAWNTMNRARNLLGVAYLATKGVDHDPCSGIAEQFATLIDLVLDKVDDAMMWIPHDGKCDASRSPNPADDRPAA